MKIKLSISTLIKIVILSIIAVLALMVEVYGNSYTANHIAFITLLNLAQTIIIILYCLERGMLKQRFALFTFNVAYFMLLQGAYVVYLGNTAFYGRHVFTNVVSISYENEVKGLGYIFLAQFMVFMAYALHHKSQYKYRNPERFDMSGLSKLSSIFMLFGGVAAFIKVGLKAIYVMKYGYLGTYLVSGNALYQNAFLDLFDKFYYVGFFGYLAAFPPLKKLRLPVASFIAYSILTLMTGVRGDLVINALFLFWYFSKRDDIIREGHTVLTKRRIAVLIVASIFGMAFLYEYGYARVGVSSTSTDFFDKLIRFIAMQGGSGKLPALGLQYKKQILNIISPIMVVVSPIRNFMINNSLVRIFTGGALGQSVENLYRVGTFGNVLTYLTNPSSYLNGAGLGTSFVAELAVVFGVVGVTVFCFILGKLFFRMDHIKLNQWAGNVLWMNAFLQLAYLPRHATMEIVPDSVVAIIFIAMVYFLRGIQTKGKKLCGRKV